jgi:hypothetical protein
VAAFDTLALLATIKRRGFVPTAQDTFASTETLAVATEELHSYLAPLMMDVRQEYFVTSSDLPLVAEQGAYRIPSRAMGGKLRDVLWLDAGGNVRNLVRLEPEAAAHYRAADTGAPEAFSLRGNYVVLHPTPVSADGNLRLSYFGRPGALVLPSACGTVESVDYATNSIVLTTGAFIADAPVLADALLDVVEARPGFATLVTEAAVGATSSVGAEATPRVLEFDSLPEGISAGDYVCLAGEACVPQVPPELHPLLALKTAAVQLEALGDTEAARVLLSELAEKQRRALSLLSPRVDGEPRKVGNGMAKWRGMRAGLFW